MKYKKGFTLIELLVVISIIGLLSTVVLASLNTAREKARDARRLFDMHQIQLALDLYYIDHNGTFPQENSSNGSWEDSTEDGGDFIDFLKDYGYMSEVPVDPINTSPYYYSYYTYTAGTSGCDASRGDFYVLGIRNLESVDGVSPISPGWYCPTRNWESEFEWVIGKFEK